MRTCASCGADNPDGDRYCESCGTPLSRPAPVTPPSKAPTAYYFLGAKIPGGFFDSVIVMGVLLVVFSCIALPLLLSTSGNRSTQYDDDRGSAPLLVKSESVPVAAPRTQFYLNETVASENWEYTVTKTEKAKSITWTEYGNKADAQGTFLVVYLTLKNVGKKNFSIHDWDFHLIDGGGIEYSTSSVYGATSFLQSKGLTSLGSQFIPGLPVKTAILFDIHPQAVGLRLRLEQAAAYVNLGF